MVNHLAILGANGFIGKSLLKNITLTNKRVVLGVRSPINQAQKGVNTLVSDYSNPEHFRALLENTSTLIHCASGTTVSTSSAHPVREFDADLRTGLALIEALQDRSDIHVIFLSSGGTVYGDQGSARLIRETDLPKPKSYHGSAKLSIEYFLRSWATQKSAALTIVRPSNIFGPGQLYRKDFGVVPALFQAITNKQKFILRGAEDTIRDFLYIDDLIDLISRILDAEHHGRQPIICNAGRGSGTALKDLIRTVEEVTQRTVEVDIEPALTGEVSSVVLNNEYALKQFGWSPKIDLKSGLEANWIWWKEQADKLEII